MHSADKKDLIESIMSYLDWAIDNNHFQILDKINNPVSIKNKLERGWGTRSASGGDIMFHFSVSKPTRTDVKRNVEYWADIELG